MRYQSGLIVRPANGRSIAQRILLDGPANAKPKRKKAVRREDPVHISIKNYLRITLPSDWLVHHSRNGGLSKAENGRAKALGALPGFPDLLIMGQMDHGALLPLVLPWFGLVEVKTDDGELSSDQRKLHKRLRALGIQVGVARSIEDTRQLVIDWNLPSNDHLVIRAREKASQAAT